MCRRVLSPPLGSVSRGHSEADTAGKTLKQQLAPLFIQDPRRSSRPVAVGLAL